GSMRAREVEVIAAAFRRPPGPGAVAGPCAEPTFRSSGTAVRDLPVVFPAAYRHHQYRCGGGAPRATVTKRG
ncbi:hypothetical protein K4H02_25730, partial [Mycobacterium tuberculosis]|nr:hypothetical protein [Mycobacterium tuberculosis]